MSHSPAVRCQGLIKRFADVVAVAGLDLEVRRGECFGLLGPNGAGKTTTIEILEGLHAGRCRRGRSPRPALGPGTRSRAARAARHLAAGNAAHREAHRRGDAAPVPHRSTGARPHRRRGARAGRARREAHALGRQALRRAEAAAGGGLRAGRRARPAVSRRADDGPRSAVAPPAVGHADAVSRRGRHDPADDALHGRGRAAVRPRRHRRSRQGHRARHAARAHRRARRRARRRVRGGRRRHARSGGAVRAARRGRGASRATAPGRWRPRKCTLRCRRCWRTLRPGARRSRTSPRTARRSRTSSSR